MRAQNRLLESFPNGYNFILLPNGAMDWPLLVAKWEKVTDPVEGQTVSAEYGGVEAGVWYSPNELAAELGNQLVPIPYVDEFHTLFHYGIDNEESGEMVAFLESKGLNNFIVMPVELLDFANLQPLDFCILSAREGKLVPKSIPVEPEPT